MKSVSVRELFLQLGESPKTAAQLISIELHEMRLSAQIHLEGYFHDAVLRADQAFDCLAAIQAGQPLDQQVCVYEYWLFENGTIAPFTTHGAIPDVGQVKCTSIPFREFHAPWRDVSKRTALAGIAMQRPPANTRARKYKEELQRFINGVVISRGNVSLAQLIQHLKNQYAVSVEGDDPAFSDVYVDGDRLCWTDRKGRQQSHSLRLDRYLRRAKSR